MRIGRGREYGGNITLSGGISSGLASNPLFQGTDLDKLLLRSTVGNALTQGVSVVTGLQRAFDWRGVAASAAGAAAGQMTGKLLGDVVGTTSLDPWAKDLVTRTGAGLAAGTAASIAQGGRVSVQQVATDAFGNALGWSVAGASLATPQSAPADGKSDWVANMKAWRSVPGINLAQAEMQNIRLDNGQNVYAPVLPEVTLSASGSGWSNPVADPTLAAAQWTVSQAVAQSSNGWNMRDASAAVLASQAQQAEQAYRTRLALSPQMTAWDGVARQSPVDTYLTRARGGLDAVRGEQWGMRVGQSLPEAAINEVGGLAVAKAVGVLGKIAAPVRGAIFGERSVMMSNLQVELRAGLQADLPIGPRLEGTVPGNRVKSFGTGGSGIPELVGPRMPDTYVTAELQQKILWGQRQLRVDGTPSNGLIGAHSGGINDSLPDYVVQVLRNNPDGTSSVKLVMQFGDGNISKIKSSTLFPSRWSDADIFESIQTVGSPGNAVATRISDGSTLYQGTVNGVNMEVIKVGNRVTSAYPTGGGFTSLDTFGLTPMSPKPPKR